jgi:hypothetical protein
MIMFDLAWWVFWSSTLLAAHFFPSSVDGSKVSPSSRFGQSENTLVLILESFNECRGGLACVAESLRGHHAKVVVDGFSHVENGLGITVFPPTCIRASSL